ncbi:MAG: LemA family protein [Candidatus Cloacimonadia bacterium]
MKKGWIILIAIIVIIVLYFVLSYNSFIRLQVDIDNSWAEVENQLKRRYDLIPNYVETVKGYAAHEQEVFTEVTKARAGVGQAQTREDMIEANNELTNALSRLMVVVERYPELKANQNFIRLQDELAGTENRLATARRRYNETVRNYNRRIRVFPNNIIANIFGFEPEVFFEAGEEAQEVPEVEF